MTNTKPETETETNLDSGINSETLNQGKKFKKNQQVITIPKNISQNSTIPATEILINKNPSINQNSVQELQDLQTKYKSLLERHQTSQAQLLSTTDNYLNTSEEPKNSNNSKNVYVASIVNNPISNYIGAYNDNQSTPAMSVINSETGYTYEQCQQEAISNSATYFGLENLNGNVAQCSISNNLSQTTQYGNVLPNCNTGSDGNTYSNNSNSFALYGANGYISCYKDNATNPSLTMSGPNISNYNSVFVCGLVGIGPWNNNGNFPDPTANWIWYTQNSQINAPYNVGAPLTLLYDFVYSGNSYIEATISACCDNGAVIYLNGTQLGTVNTWNTVGTNMPVTLAPGSNYISAAVINEGVLLDFF